MANHWFLQSSSRADRHHY